MCKESYSINVNERDMNPLRKPIEREQINYNYGPLKVGSNYATYPNILIFIPNVIGDITQKHLFTREERRKELSLAAEALLSDYLEDKELTVFTSIDNDDFHE